MTAILLALILLAGIGGACVSWWFLTLRPRETRTDEAAQYPPWMSLELQDIQQRRAWRRLTDDERQWLVDALWTFPRSTQGGAT